MKRKLLKFILIGGVVLVSAFCGVVYLSLEGHIPSFADTEDVSYEKLLGIRPSFGRVWQHAAGFGDGFCYYRLHLSHHDFDASGLARSTRLSTFTRPMHAPIWWNPRPDSALAFSGGGLGYHTENLYIYDSRRELLFARCEWN